MTTSPEATPVPDLDGYEVLVAVCGGIAAYKVCSLVSTLVQRGAGVSVAMTKSATRLVGPVTFQALTGRRVFTNLFKADQASEIQHIALTGATDLLLVAPATANIIGKIAAGIADDVVSTLVIGAASPVLLAPAMNDRMWTNPVVQRNLTDLKDRKYSIVGPGEGWLACRSVGPGRMAEPDQIIEVLIPMLKAEPAKGAAKEE